MATPASRACPAARSSATPETSSAVTSQPPLGEPDGVRALAAADVEHPPRREPGDLGDQRTVGLAAPQLLPVRVAGVPFRLHRRISDISVGSRVIVGCGWSCCDVVGHRPTVAYRAPVLPLPLPIRQNVRKQPAERGAVKAGRSWRPAQGR